MSSKALEKMFRELSSDVIQLRSFVISVAGKDADGAYRPEFIKEIRKAGGEKPMHEFTGKGSLLKLLRKSK